jgi:hypothetical protein
LSGLQVKRALERDDVLALLYDHHACMRAVFDKYGSSVIDVDADVLNAGTADESLNIAEFGLILEHAHLLGGNNKAEDELTFKEARQAFAGAQNALCGEEDQVKIIVYIDVK